MQQNLKLITRYDATRNEFTLHRHNLTAEEADEALREISARLFGLFIVNQHAKHSGDDPDKCRACRRDVHQKAHVQPQPKFKRRQQ